MSSMQKHLIIVYANYVTSGPKFCATLWHIIQILYYLAFLCMALNILCPLNINKFQALLVNIFYLFNTDLLSAYCVPDTLLGTGDRISVILELWIVHPKHTNASIYNVLDGDD